MSGEKEVTSQLREKEPASFTRGFKAMISKRAGYKSARRATIGADPWGTIGPASGHGGAGSGPRLDRFRHPTGWADWRKRADFDKISCSELARTPGCHRARPSGDL